MRAAQIVFFQTRLKKEVLPAIEKLKELGKVEFYLLFTNAKLTGKQDVNIENLIEGISTEIPNVVIANEKIQQWLKSYPDVVREAKLNELLLPLQFDESDLKQIIKEFGRAIDKDLEFKSVPDFAYIEPIKKNDLNQLSKAYFDDVIKRNFTYFESIGLFLKNPINSELKELYDDTVSELNAKISLKRDEYAAFENLLEELFDYVVFNNSEYNGSGKKRLIRVFLHYMYCNCDIGKKENA